MIRPRTRWLSVAAATLVVSAVLPASAALADTTPGAITGHLLDGTTPVPNVTVDVISPSFSFAGEATTDANGAFTVNDIAPGTYIVQFNLPGGVTQYSHSRSSFETADLITVSAGTTVTDEEAVIPHGALGGTLTDSNGAPVANASVSVASTVFLSTRTDSTGHYLLPIVPAGTYTVSFFTTSGIGQTAHGKAPGQQGDQFTVTVGATTTTVDEQLIAPGTFTGQVTTADGLPAAGIEVFASSQFSSQFGLTDANGQYSINVFPGSYQLAFERMPGSLTQWAHGQKSSATAQSFSVASGATAVVDEQLLPTGTLAGHLNDANGQPVPFGLVDIEGDGRFMSTNISNGDWHVDTYPGTYTVAFDVSSPVSGKQWATGKASAAAADTFTVQVGQTTRVDDTLAAAGTLTITVVDSVTGASVDYCADIGEALFLCADSTGTLTAPPQLPGPVPIIVFPRDGHLELDTTATVVSGQNTAVNLTATPGATITTTVRDSKTGYPVGGICVTAVPLSSPSGASAGIGNCTNSSGQVTIPGLAANSYNLFAFANDGVHGHQWVGPAGGTGIKEKAAVVSVTAGQSVAVPDIRMDKAGTLTGVIRDKVTGAGIAGAVASWGTSSAGLGGSNADVTADANGRYTFTNLGPYDWPIFYHAAGYASEWSGNTGNRLKSNPVTVRAGRTRTHNEALTQGVTLTGLVTDATGSPMSAFASRITVFNADSHDEIGSDDNAADGTYTLHVLPRQSVTLLAMLFVDPPVTFFYTNPPGASQPTPIKIQKPGPVIINMAAPAG
jgi:protocatechuate 3,4-dioxygenase beta subunit